jgi:hypothetical protein
LVRQTDDIHINVVEAAVGAGFVELLEKTVVGMP